VALAAAAPSLLLDLAASALPLFATPQIDRPVLLFALALAVLAPLVFALPPAIYSSRFDRLAERSQAASPRTTSARNVLVACEVGLSVVLVVGAVLLARSLIRLQQVDPGFSADHVVTFKLTLPNVRYPKDADQVRAFGEIERRLRALAGVEAVGATSTLALRGNTWTGDATVEGRGDDYERELRHESVTPDYFRAMGIRLIAGRFLDERDGEGSNVTLVNNVLATRYFRGADPLGKRIKFGRPGDRDPWVTIVGIVADQKQDAIDKPAEPEVYVPLAENSQNPLTFVVRSAAETDRTVARARDEVRRVDKDLTLTDVATLAGVVHEAIAGERFRTTLLSAFAGVALFLAAIGVYGVVSYLVTQRARELGIRLALGARPSALFRLVIGQGMRPVVVGAAVGLVSATALSGVMKSLLFGVAALDPPTYVMTSLAIATIALAACAVPALRATRVDPLVALREE
jgi:putative ABC transport system permease protein